MAERFEPYHVPQQSRRDKLRVLGQNHHQGCIDNMVSFHDPSLLASDLLTSSSNDNSVKNESHVNLMGYQQHMYTDPRNPSTILDNYTQQGGARFLDQSFHGGRGGGGGVDVVVYRPEAVSESATRTTTGQGLSLSLSSSNAHQRNLPRYDSSEMVNSGGRYIVSDVNGGGPFTGYASVLKGSRFLKPAHQLMEELCDVGKGIYVEKFVSPDTTLMDPPPLMEGNGVLLDDPESCSDGSDHSRRKSKLISMLHEVYRRYKQYYQQMQAVIASFESGAGLSNAAPFANSAFRSMSKHFKTLKNALIDQLQFITKSHFDNDEITRFGNSGRGNFGQRSCGVVDHQQPVWRPQRGLPERAVSVLKSWLFDHFLHPYPTDTDKLMLAKQTGLSRNQVSNWFINARVRLWKPMVEEIHMLETQEAQKASQRNDQSAPRINENKGLASENLSASTPKGSDFPSKRTRNNTGGDNYGGGEMNLSYNNFAHHSHPAIGANVVSGNNGVQLTLGLHQNNGISLSDRFPLTSALTSTQRFGFDNDGYVLGGYEGQNCQFRRNIVEGQLVHDFVG